MNRQVDDKRRALPFAPAVGADGPTVAFHDVPDDRQSNSQAAMHPGRKTASLPEAFENVRQEVGANADTGITDANVRAAGSVFQSNFDGAPLPREFDSV